MPRLLVRFAALGLLGCASTASVRSAAPALSPAARASAPSEAPTAATTGPAIPAPLPVPAPLPAARACAEQLDALNARQGAIGRDSPGLLTVDTWDQTCQWRVEDIEDGLIRYWEQHRGQGTGAEALGFAGHRAETETVEYVNGPVPPDALDAALRRVRLSACFQDVPNAPARIRVRFTVRQTRGSPQNIATDYRAEIPDAAKACVTRELARTSFPGPSFGKWAIVVRAFDARTPR
jgi:hypothetical protein